MTIKDKVVLITGASEGIGAACAREFRRRGARLSLTARSEGKLKEVGGADSAITAGDLMDPDVRRRVVERTAERFGAIDILINGSIAGKVSLPWFTLYSATKFALGSLTEGLRMELADEGIRTMIVCPGYVKTGFQGHVLVGEAPDRLLKGKKFAITAEQCAKAVARGVERNARTVVTPAIGWALVAAQRLLPSLVEAQMRKIYRSGAT